MSGLETALWLLAGIALGGLFILIAGITSERIVLSVGLPVATIIYVGFAAMWANGPWLAIELLGVAVYGSVGWLGLRRSAWWLVAGWTLHPVWDVVLHLVGPGAAFAPVPYAVSCITFDLLVALYVAWRFVASAK